MFSLQKLLGKEDKFFDLLEASAVEGKTSVQSLVKFLQNPGQLRSLDEFIQSRRKDKAITAEISEELCKSFVTAIEREDIESLSVALYKIPKTVEKIAERIMIAPHHLQGVDLSKQITILDQSADKVVAMIKELRAGIHLERIKVHNDQLQKLEGEADKHVLSLLAGLYKTSDPVRVVYLKDLYELLEKVIDRCRDAGNVINHIVLKNS